MTYSNKSIQLLASSPQELSNRVYVKIYPSVPCHIAESIPSFFNTVEEAYDYIYELDFSISQCHDKLYENKRRKDLEIPGPSKSAEELKRIHSASAVLSTRRNIVVSAVDRHQGTRSLNERHVLDRVKNLNTRVAKLERNLKLVGAEELGQIKHAVENLQKQIPSLKKKHSALYDKVEGLRRFVARLFALALPKEAKKLHPWIELKLKADPNFGEKL